MTPEDAQALAAVPEHMLDRFLRRDAELRVVRERAQVELVDPPTVTVPAQPFVDRFGRLTVPPPPLPIGGA